MSINNKTAAPTTAAPASATLMELLAGEIARQAQGFRKTEAEAKAKAKEVVGTDADLLTLQTMEAEAESLGLPAEFLATFKAKAKQGRELLIEAEAAGQAARRLGLTSTPEGLQAHLDKVKAKEAAEKEAAAKAKAKEAARKEAAAKEERIAEVVGMLGDITTNQKHAVACFLRGNPEWSFIPTEGGRKALLGAAGRAAAEFKKARDLEAKAAKAAKAAAAPLSHNLKLK